MERVQLLRYVSDPLCELEPEAKKKCDWKWNSEEQAWTTAATSTKEGRSRNASSPAKLSHACALEDQLAMERAADSGQQATRVDARKQALLEARFFNPRGGEVEVEEGNAGPPAVHNTSNSSPVPSYLPPSSNVGHILLTKKT